LDGLRIHPGKVVLIAKLLTEGVGVRAAARLADCDPATVLAVLETLGRKCSDFLDRKVRNLTVASLQLDELHGRVGISQRHTTPADRERGDFYTFLALDARSKLIVSHYTGKRDYESTDAFVADLASRITGRVQITTDGWPAYPDCIRSHLLDRLDYALMQKIYQADNHPEATRRYAPPRCVGVQIEVRAGNPRPDRISTSYVERVNLSVRTFNRRFVRLGLGWSRKLDNHRHAIALFVAAYNFCKRHSTTGTSPAHGAGLTDGVWSIEELLETAAQNPD
jgi:IS1 family transposase